MLFGLHPIYILGIGFIIGTMIILTVYSWQLYYRFLLNKEYIYKDGYKYVKICLGKEK